MFDDRHTVLPHGTFSETDIYPVDVAKAGDHRDAQSLPRDSTGLRTRRNWYVVAAAGAILTGAGGWGLRAPMAMPEQGTVPPSPPVVTAAPPLPENVTNRTELTGHVSAAEHGGLRAQVSGY